MNVHLDERAIPDGFGKRGKRGETGKLGTNRGTDATFPLLRKPPIVMSQTSLVKQTSEGVPSVLRLQVKARRRWRTILLPEQPPLK